MKGRFFFITLTISAIAILAGLFFITYLLYSSESAEPIVFFFLFSFFLFLIVILVRVQDKTEFIKRRFFYYFLVLVPFIAFASIVGYRYYFLIMLRSIDTNIQNGKSKEIRVFGTIHQNKLYEFIVDGTDNNYREESLTKPDWSYDTTWVYYNSFGEQIEKRNRPKIYPQYYSYMNNYNGQ